jgi:adenine-specific DNA glycosylase
VPNGEARCAACPVREQCEANRLGVVDDLPVRGPKAKRRIAPRTVLLLREDGTPPRYALRKRPPTGLLAGLWEFPHLEGHRTADEVLEAVRAMGLEPLRIRPLSPAKHIFSHVEWHMNAYELFLADPAQPNAGEGLVFLSAAELCAQYTLPSAHAAWRDVVLGS